MTGNRAGAPAWHWANQMINATWNSRATLQDASAITAQSTQILNKAILAACDKLDGVEDGVISDPRRCHFEPATLLCKAGNAADTCLTQPQIDAANQTLEKTIQSLSFDEKP